MHLLATQTGVVDGGAEAVDLAQDPADIVIISAADSELACLARANDRLKSPKPTLRLANLMALGHHLSVDTYVERTISASKLVFVRLLGGRSYWPYGIEQLTAMKGSGLRLAFLPGGGEPDPELTRLSSLPAGDCERLRSYFAAGGEENASLLLQYSAHLLGRGEAPPGATSLAKAGLYGGPQARADGRPVAAIVFYRALIEGGLTAPVDALADALAERGLAAMPIFVSGLKDAESAAEIERLFRAAPPDIILNATGFAVASVGRSADPLAAYGCPVLQVVFSGTSEEAWASSARGLPARDLAMNVVLPELDGRVLTRAVSFKADSELHAATQCRIVTYRPVQDRIDFVADLARNWVRLARTPAPERRVAIVLANYPNRDGRIGNGVGYDTPASTVAILDAMRSAGYTAADYPADGNALIEALQTGPTNSGRNAEGPTDAILPLDAYARWFAGQPESVRQPVTERWGDPASDPFVRDGAFRLPVRRYGHVAVAIQPARGYNIDPKSTYHDPALPPPHGYFAFYLWLRESFGAHAVIHNGKHGNLEWLPGKATGLSAACFPEAALGPLPQLYPFIVNDPGEGTQAKRRTSAVIIDHLTPPLTRAESYGPQRELETLLDEYYLAAGLDRRRVGELERRILDFARDSRLYDDAGIVEATNDTDALRLLDAFLCDLKEAQIRDGLHVLGSSPTGAQEANLLVALTRLPRGDGKAGDQSLVRALADDLSLDFDPLDCDLAEPWTGPRPAALVEMSEDPWRTCGDTVERLELLAARLLSSPSVTPTPALPPRGGGGSAPFVPLTSSTEPAPSFPPPPCGEGSGAGVAAHENRASSTPPLPLTTPVLAHVESHIRPTLRSCGAAEISALLSGLAGRAIPPGPSGAPTRGRLDVLPTGRNFFSIDNRAVPTPTAWSLGQRSAEALLARHFQDHGRYPKAIGLSVWGTSNMRTGGDDIAQALALIGAKPVWEPASGRVTGYEIIPLPRLGRPRVDVTLRISGLFRDAFPAQIELFDRAVRAIGALDEDASDNPVAERMGGEAADLAASGLAPAEASAVAGTRVFGSMPGAYGAGLQALIDEKLWAERADLAHAYVAWGCFAYGANVEGTDRREAFTRRLARIEAVVHNQDNREHDLLDSDDYYQFEGGMTAAVEQASGRRPQVYHNDHSRPEKPKVRTLEEEVGRVMRSRVVNPKWIAGVRRHGYKGAFEIAATVDYMFAFAATTGAVKSHHFDLAYDAFIADEEVNGFLAGNNPEALREIADRFEEAIARGLWAPRSNAAHRELARLREGTRA